MRYSEDFWEGMSVAVDLVRGGASIDSVAALLATDPATADPQGYQHELGELRRIMNTLFDGLGGG